MVATTKIWAIAVLVAGVFCVADSMAAELLSVRIGPHKSFDRMVFEFNSETPSYVQFKSEQKLEVLFKNVAARKGFALPALPTGLVAIRGVDAYQVGTSDIAFEITLAKEVTPTELPLSGQPFRLAVDLSPKVAKNESEKPEYIPGDKPIPTRFADAAHDSGEMDSSAEDPAKANSILAYYYLNRGDTQEAQKQAQAYVEKTGAALDVPLPAGQNGETSSESSESENSSPKNTAWASIWLIILLAGGTGLLAGALGALLVARWTRKNTNPIPVSRATNPRALSEEVQQDLATLKAKVSEPVAAKIPVEKTAAAPVMTAPVPADETEESQESLMDRRVKRVLELSQQGKSIADIAEALEMAQDEVKLILDLNM